MEFCAVEFMIFLVDISYYVFFYLYLYLLAPLIQTEFPSHTGFWWRYPNHNRWYFVILYFCWYQISISISSSLIHYLFYSFSRCILFVWHCDSRSTNDFSSIEFSSHLRVIWSHISDVTILVNPLDLLAVFAFQFLLNGTTKMSKILLLEFLDYIF